MDYELYLAIIVLIWVSLGLSQGVVSGYLGILAINQAASWGIGAYTAALLNTRYGLPLGVTALPGGLAAGVFAMLSGWLVGSARREDQVITSLCIQIIVIEAFLNFSAVTNGPLGIANIGGGGGYEERSVWALVAAAALAVVTAGVFAALRATRLSTAWLLIRDDRPTAESLGIDVAKLRSLAFFYSAFVAGVAGTIYAHYMTFIDPQSFGLTQSVAILTIAIIGRAPSLVGICAAAAILVLLPEALRFEGIGGVYTANLRQALFGAFLVISLFVSGRRYA